MKNKCLIGYSLYFVLATVNLIMERIIQQLKEQREKAEKTFIKNSFIKRRCKIDAPCPDVDADLDAIGELNQAISILENYEATKEPVSNCC